MFWKNSTWYIPKHWNCHFCRKKWLLIQVRPSLNIVVIKVTFKFNKKSKIAAIYRLFHLKKQSLCVFAEQPEVGYIWKLFYNYRNLIWYHFCLKQFFKILIMWLLWTDASYVGHPVYLRMDKKELKIKTIASFLGCYIGSFSSNNPWVPFRPHKNYYHIFVYQILIKIFRI